MLNIVNKSPLERNAFDTCLATAQPGGAILLIEDGIYAATKGNAAAAKLEKAMSQFKVYALAPDVDARGMGGAVMSGVTLVDYGGFVELVAEHNTCQSWL